MHKPLLLLAASLPLFITTGCASLFEDKPSVLLVSSTPPAADVYVMGQLQGVTPLSVPVDALYPSHYPTEFHHLYGKVELRHVDCQPLLTKVDWKMFKGGLSLSMDCGQDELKAEQGAVSKSVAERLSELDELRKKGLVSEQEYADLRGQILSDL